MQAISDSIYATAPAQRLLARELAALGPLLEGIYGQYGLLIRPPGLAASPPHLLGNLTVLETGAAGQFGGAVSCAPEALPFLTNSFKLVLLQHATEAVAAPPAFAAEIARVLAPEGVALILAFNPFSAWRPWLALQQRQRPATSALRIASALFWEHHLNQHDIDVMQTRYLGSLLPRGTGGANAAERRHWLTPLRGAYLLLARKRRSTLTPLRMRPSRERAAPAPYLVPGTRRSGA